jgi:general secretion pathway protein J
MLRNKGFTLLEVLLAITVLGIVIAMLTLSLSGTLKVVDGTEQQEAMYHQVQVALRRVSEDLGAAVQIAEVAFIGKQNNMNSERADTLEFTSMAHLIFNPEKQVGGMAVIRYQVKADADDERKLKLLRSDTLMLPGGEDKADTAEDYPFLLADNLRSVRFTYYDREGQESDNWQKTVDSDAETEAQPLPAAVQCTLEFWIDPEQETSQTFSTGVLIPTGVVTAETQSEN